MANTAELLATAVKHHQGGRLHDAELIYRQILQADPNQADAIHLLGVIASQVGMHAQAVEYIQRAIRLYGNNAAYHNNLGGAYRALHRFSEAADSYRRAVELKPDYAEAYSNLGLALTDEGKLDDAVLSYRQALSLQPNLVDAQYNLGNVLKDQGKVDEAAACYRGVLDLKPEFAEPHYQLGVILHGQGKLDDAIACYRQALKWKPQHAEAHNNLGVALAKEEELDEAVACYQRALQLKPEYAEAHFNLGVALKEQGKLDEAIASYRRALELKPDFAKAMGNLGFTLKEQGKLDEAIACYHKALEMNPDAAEVHNNLGIALKDQDKLDEAIAAYRRALQLRPNYADAAYNLGNAVKEQGKLDEAIASYRRALELKPDYTDAQNSLGIGMQLQGRVDAAATCFRRVLQFQPENHDAHNNLGNVLREGAQVTAALASYRRALQLNPDFAEALSNLGSALKDQCLLDEAFASYRRALELKPDFSDVRSNMIFSLNYRPGVTLAKLAEAHAEFDRRYAMPPPASWPVQELHRETARPLRLGFVSPDFCQHPVSVFLIRPLENLDRHEVEIVCYNDRGPQDRMTARFQAVSTVWRDVLGWNHEQLATRIRDDKIDILFDLAGHTACNRMLTFVRKPAPIQITWIGYEGTTGLSAIDYLIADRYMVPEGAESHYREKVLRLPGCYVCFDPPEDAPAVSPLPALRSGHVTFGSCNNLAKLNDEVIVLWAEILRRVPHSRLLLKYRGLEDETLRGRYFALFATHGIGAERLDIEGWSPLRELFARHDAIDVALDPFPFAGGVTTCIAMWMGVPVVTWPGETFASRHALSYLSTIGLTETIAASREEYVEIAAGLAADLPRLAAIRTGLRPQMAASPLCDGKRFAEQLMELLRGIVGARKASQ